MDVTTIAKLQSDCWGITVDAQNNVFVANIRKHIIQKISADGEISIFAGKEGQEGHKDGNKSDALFRFPLGLLFDQKTNVLFVTEAHCVREIQGEVVTTLCGSREKGINPGSGINARFNGPRGMTIDNSQQHLIVADFWNNQICEISRSGHVTRVASSFIYHYPLDVDVDSAGSIFVSDSGNHCIRKIESTAPSDIKLEVNQCLTDCMPVQMIHIIVQYLSHQTVSTFARVPSPSGMAIDMNDNIYVASYDKNCVYKISPTGQVTSVAGNGQKQSTDGTAANASFDGPEYVALDHKETCLFVTSFDGAVRRITL